MRGERPQVGGVPLTNAGRVEESTACSLLRGATTVCRWQRDRSATLAVLSTAWVLTPVEANGGDAGTMLMTRGVQVTVEGAAAA